jgi:hypothetical protein
MRPNYGTLSRPPVLIDLGLWNHRWLSAFIVVTERPVALPANPKGVVHESPFRFVCISF